MVFLDANILLEVLLPNRLHYKKVAKYLQSLSHQPHISVLSARILLYFGDKNGLTKEQIELALKSFIIQDLLFSDYQSAMKLVVDRDYEDALQLSVAIRAGCGSIITLDKKFAKRYGGKMKFTVIS